MQNIPRIFGYQAFRIVNHEQRKLNLFETPFKNYKGIYLSNPVHNEIQQRNYEIGIKNEPMEVNLWDRIIENCQKNQAKEEKDHTAETNTHHRKENGYLDVDLKQYQANSPIEDAAIYELL